MEKKIFSSTILKRGEIAIKRKYLVNHINWLENWVIRLDEVMKEKESYDRGTKIAKLANEINWNAQSMKSTLLKMPIKDLHLKAK